MIARALACAVLAIAVAAAPARADETLSPDVLARARALNDRGRAAHDAGDYATAIAAFKEAYVLAPSVGVVFNLAQAYRLHGDCADAALMYRRYLASAASEDGREIAALHLATVEHCTEPAAKVAPPLAPGHGVLDAPTTIASSPSPAAGRTRRRAGAALAITGGTLLVASVVLAIDARGAAADVSRVYTTGGAWSTIAATDARGQRDAQWADGLAIGGGLGVLGGAAIYLLGRRADEQPPIALSVSAHGAQASVAWRF